MIDTYLDQNSRQVVKLFEDNAGGLWLVDTDQQWAWNMDINGNMGNSFYADAGDLFADEVGGWETENRHPYSEAVEPRDETKLVAEYDGNMISLYPDKMGHSAKQYCGLATSEYLLD